MFKFYSCKNINEEIIQSISLFLLPTVSADNFQYTCMGGDITIEGVDDKRDMEETRRTFSLLGKKSNEHTDFLVMKLFVLA